MTQTIEQLTARVRELETQLAANNPLLDEAANRIDELEEENARLRFALADTEALELGTSERLATLTRQRDLAVEAASDAATSLETIQLRSFGEESYLDSKPQMRAFAGARAKIARDIISTIKESEAMAQGEKP